MSIRAHATALATAPAVLFASILVLSACASSAWERELAVDDAGSGAPVSESATDASDASGSPADVASDPKAVRESARLDALARAARRAPGDFIEVALLPLQRVGERPTENGVTLGELYDQAFVGDDVVRVVDPERVAEAWTAANGDALRVVVPTDVLVEAQGALAVRAGTSGASRLTLFARVHSAYDQTALTVEESGPSDRSLEIFERFRHALRHAIVERMGADLPRHADALRREPYLEGAERRRLEAARRSD